MRNLKMSHNFSSFQNTYLEKLILIFPTHRGMDYFRSSTFLFQVRIALYQKISEKIEMNVLANEQMKDYFPLNFSECFIFSHLSLFNFA